MNALYLNSDSYMLTPNSAPCEGCASDGMILIKYPMLTVNFNSRGK